MCGRGPRECLLTECISSIGDQTHKGPQLMTQDLFLPVHYADEEIKSPSR